LGALGVPYGKLNIAIELPSNEAVLEAVLAGAGATILSARVCADVIKAGTLKRLPVTLAPRAFYSMLTVIDLVQFRHYWKSFAHTPHCDLLLGAGAHTSSVSLRSTTRRRRFTPSLIFKPRDHPLIYCCAGPQQDRLHRPVRYLLIARWTSVPHIADPDQPASIWVSTVTRLPLSVLSHGVAALQPLPRRLFVLLLPQGVVKISGTLIERAGARVDTHIGAGETRVLPIDVDALSAARAKQCSKAAN
jgi:hypothetical protein